MNRLNKVLAPMLHILKLTRTGQLEKATVAIQEALADQSSRARPVDARIVTVRRSGAAPAAASVPRLEQDRARHAEEKALDTPAVRQLHAGQFITRSFTNAAGTRGYKLYLPHQVREGMSLVVMLHGCTQTADDFAAGTRMNELAELHGFIVAYPDQTRSANQANCWNWFSDINQQRGAGEPSIIAGIASQVASDYAVDRTRIYIAGLSAGGAMAASVAATYPDVFAAVGVHSGLADGSAHDIPSALAAMKQGSAGPRGRAETGGLRPFVPTIVFHGDKDGTVNPVNGVQVVEQALGRASGRMADSGPVIEQGRAELEGHGRSYTRNSYKDSRGLTIVDHWSIHGARHAWSGGSSTGSHTDEQGPDASGEMFRFFSSHALTQ